MGENGLSASDVALLNNDGMGGNGWGRHDLALRNPSTPIKFIYN